MYFLYSLVTLLGMVACLPYFVIRSLRGGRGGDWGNHIRQRLGFAYPRDQGQVLNARPGETIWIHAVSVGEVLAVAPLVNQLKLRHPQRHCMVSTTTVTGQRIARERLTVADGVFYFPLDWEGPVRRALDFVKPAAILIVETEIWPNFLRECRRAHVPVVFVNGRLSDRSSRGFLRAIRLSGGILRGFLGRILNDATLYMMQAEQDASRIMALGADPDRVIVTGNLKYDLADPPETPFSRWLAAETARKVFRPIVVAGSIAGDEEQFVLRAFDMLIGQFPNALLILAPRKPDRFRAAAESIESSGHTLIRRSGIDLCAQPTTTLPAKSSVLLLDTLGELASVYAHADVVFVGGSLVPSGGHNILEPAAFSKAPVFGIFMENFSEMAALFLKEAAAIQVGDWAALGNAWITLLTDPGRAAQMGRAARNLIETNRGATSRILSQVEAVLANAGKTDRLGETK